MKFKIKRVFDKKEEIVEYEVPLKEPTLLEALEYVKIHIDRTLSFLSGCRSEVCGSCAVLVNSREQLSCAYKLKEGDLVEAIRHGEVIRDLIVDIQKPLLSIKRAHAFLEDFKESKITKEDEKRIERQSDCILCSSCFSVCPVLEVNENFLGPFSLTRVYRYVNDKRENDIKTKIDIIQKNGIWDCTLCGECTAVCPQGIDPKNDILMLRVKSGEFGYQDPNFSSFDNFGFNPNF